MTIMGSDKEVPASAEQTGQPVETTVPTANPPKNAEPAAEPKSDTPKAEEKKDNIFSETDLTKTSTVPEVTVGTTKKTVELDATDKVTFIDAIVNNTRYMKEYALFGGKVTLTLRSLTNDEVNALSSWIAKQGSADPAGLLSGRYRKYLVAAQVEIYNGTKMPPLEEPLFETLGKDGKTVEPPGWINRCSYWDGMSVGLFGAIMGCIEDFDARYALLCQKADDSNFWHPDTP